MPTTPMTSSSSASSEAACWPTSGVRLVVLRVELDRHVAELAALVGLRDRQVDGVLDAEPEGGQVTGERSDDTDLDGARLTATRLFAAAAGVVGLRLVAVAAGRECEGAGEHSCADLPQGVLTHWFLLMRADVQVCRPIRTRRVGPARTPSHETWRTVARTTRFAAVRTAPVTFSLPRPRRDRSDAASASMVDATGPCWRAHAQYRRTAGLVESADTAPSKGAVRKDVRVRVPHPAPRVRATHRRARSGGARARTVWTARTVGGRRRSASPIRCTRRAFVEPAVPGGLPATMTTRSPGTQRPSSSIDRST